MRPPPSATPPYVLSPPSLPKSFWPRFPPPLPQERGKGRGGWSGGKRGECLQPQWRGHWANGQLGTLGEMGQSFLDKHGFLSAYKNTTFTYLLAPCPGSWEQTEGGTEERLEDKAGTVWGGGMCSRQRGSGPESQKHAAGRFSSLPTYHPSGFYSYFRERGESYSPGRLLHFISSLYMLCLCLGSECICYDIFNRYSSSTDYVKRMDAVLNKAVMISVLRSLEPVAVADD